MPQKQNDKKKSGAPELFKYIVTTDKCGDRAALSFLRNSLSTAAFTSTESGYTYCETTCHVGLWCYLSLAFHGEKPERVAGCSDDGKVTIKGSPHGFSFCLRTELDAGRFRGAVLSGAIGSLEYKARFEGTFPEANVAVVSRTVAEERIKSGATLEKGPTFYYLVNNGVVRGEVTFADGDKIKAKERQEKLFRQYQKNPDLPFKPSKVVAYKKIPEICPRDATPLLHLTGVNGHKAHEGMCCIFCKTLYLQKVAQKPKREPQIPKKLLQQAAKQEAAEKLRAKKKAERKAAESEKSPLERLPKSKPTDEANTAILSVRLKIRDLCVRYMLIVDDAKEQQTDKGIYWMGRGIAAQILTAVLRGEQELYISNNHVMIAETAHRELFREYQARFRELCDGEPVEVYVYRDKRAVPIQTELVTVFLYFPLSDRYAAVETYHDVVRNQYYINYDTYTQCVQRYGVPYVRPVEVSEGDFDPNRLSTLRQMSRLKLLGYSAGEENSDEVRRGILKRIIDSRAMDPIEIASHIEFLLNLNRYKSGYEDTVQKWKRDLDFVLRYRAEGRKRAIGARPPRT